MRKLIVFSTCIILTACSAADYEGFRAPSLSGDPARMSADTLCYRAAYAKENPALQEEVRARNLDCAQILDAQPHGGDTRY